MADNDSTVAPFYKKHPFLSLVAVLGIIGSLLGVLNGSRDFSGDIRAQQLVYEEQLKAAALREEKLRVRLDRMDASIEGLLAFVDCWPREACEEYPDGLPSDAVQNTAIDELRVLVFGLLKHAKEDCERNRSEPAITNPVTCTGI